MRTRVITTVAGLLLPAAPAHAWNATGHEAVALVAWDHLTPATRAKLTALLEQHPRRDKDLLARLRPGDDRAVELFCTAATWPDIIRSPMNPLSRTQAHSNWHYADIPFDQDGQHGPDPVTTWDGHSTPTNLIQAMAKVTTEIVAPGTPAPQRAMDLCWIEHMVGDIHQPLHAVSEYSDALPKGDRGGNEQSVSTPQYAKENLHSLWDGIEGRSTDPAVIRKVADRVEHEHPPAELARAAADQNVVDWARESHDAAVHDAYLDGHLKTVVGRGAGDVPPEPAGYEDRARAVSDGRIALGGERLAVMLEGIAGKLPAGAGTRATTRP